MNNESFQATILKSWANCPNRLVKAWCVVVTPRATRRDIPAESDSVDTGATTAHALDARTVVTPKTQRRLDRMARVALQPRCLDRGTFTRADARNVPVSRGPAWCLAVNEGLYS